MRVCDRWRWNFQAFLADVGPRPAPGYSIDRYPDNDGNYESGNVRWATKSEQMLNTRKTRRDETGRPLPKRPRRGASGRPVINPGGKPRTITITDEAWQKAEEDAEVLSEAAGIRVSTSQAIDVAVRAFNAAKFKP